ncbi:hypothetical protein NHX12_009936 [Muraenolepis orangiensis]|uniref:non-specific serine/threonine protein kinase n=1 Tax=Muraenolepis orangiensis TaxID=630683 RepID=A0A9Q0DIL1_9TELE|nr:hypothetical protein NHX12_009936 [Muraenolepis orangiensis]
MNSYHVLGLVGEGSFGRVHKGRKRFSGQVVALKFIPKVGRSEKELRGLKREIEIMRGLEHPNIVQMFDSFETDKEVVVVTEYAEGELFQMLEDDGHLPENQVQEIACQLVSALYYLHSHRILHRDMKPQNILLGKCGVVKLCDFGFARSMSVSTLVLTSIKGTPLYMSPELVDEKPYDHTADLWSLGCILYELHTGVPPFYTNSIFQLVKLIVREPVKWPEDNMSPTCLDFLKGLLTKDPQQRLSWPHLLNHPFVANRVVGDSVFSPLTVAPSSDLLALKHQQVKEKGQISRDYEQEFPSVDVGPRFTRNCSEDGQKPSPGQDEQTEDYWRRLALETEPEKLVSNHHLIIPQLKHKLLAFKSQLLDGILEDSSWQILYPLRVISKLLLNSDRENSHRVGCELGLPHLFFDLTGVLVDKLNVIRALAASLLSMFTHHGVSVDVDIDITLSHVLKYSSQDPKPQVYLPPGWGLCDGLLSLLLHSVSEHGNGSRSPSPRPEVWCDLWRTVGASLEAPTLPHICSTKGLHSFLSAALCVFTKDPALCLPLFSHSQSECKEDLDNLSALSCLLLCFPFSLDLSARTRAGLLDLYDRCGVVSGLLQMIQTGASALLELPLSLLSRLLLCDPDRFVPRLTTASPGARDFFFFFPPSGPPPTTARGDHDHDHHDSSSVPRTASSLLGALLQTEPLWDSAAELLVLLAQVARHPLGGAPPGRTRLHLDAPVLRRALAHPHERLRASACSLLGNLNPLGPGEAGPALGPSVFREMTDALRDPCIPVRRMACWAEDIRESGGWAEESARMVPLLLSLVTDPDALTRRHSCAALGNLGRAYEECGVSGAPEAEAFRPARRRAAVATLSVFSGREALRRVLVSLDAYEKVWKLHALHLHGTTVTTDGSSSVSSDLCFLVYFPNKLFEKNKVCVTSS